MGQNKVGAGVSPGVTIAVALSANELGSGVAWESCLEALESIKGMNWEKPDLSVLVRPGLVVFFVGSGVGVFFGDSGDEHPTSNKHRKTIRQVVSKRFFFFTMDSPGKCYRGGSKELLVKR